MPDKHYTHRGDRTYLELALRRTFPWFEANATFLIYGLATVLAVAAAFVWIRRQPAENSDVSAMWIDADDPEAFQSIADQFVGTELGSLARLKQVDTLLNSASRKMFTDRGAAQQELDLADAAINRLVNATLHDDVVHARVLLCQARLAEVRCDGTEESVATATKAWQDFLNFLDQTKTTMGSELAERRIAKLGKSATADFYAWFHALDPKPADDLEPPDSSGDSSTGPSSGVPTVPPNLELPILPDLTPVEDSDADANETVSPDGDAESDGRAETDDETPSPPDDLSTSEQKTPADAADSQSDPDSDAASRPVDDESAVDESDTQGPDAGEPVTDEPSADESDTEAPAEPEPDSGE